MNDSFEAPQQKNSFYPHLFTPLIVHNHSIKNRSVMGAMHTGLEEKRKGFERLASYFKERAEGGVGLIITGGISPNFSGKTSLLSPQLSFMWQIKQHQHITQTVHEAGSKIAMQLLHTGRYAYHPFSVAPSAIKSPITPFKPRSLSEKGIQKTIHAFAHSAMLAKKSGYDGVEIMGSEGYLINQFIVSKTNTRTDQWGGDFSCRIRFPIKIIEAIREITDPNFIIIFRLSMLDLIENGSSFDEVVFLGKAIEAAGASMISTGIGWHESRVPTILTCVPRANFSWVTQKIKAHLSIPVITSNRINTPEMAEKILHQGDADMISMARPFLADPHFMKKAEKGKSNSINTCIACNQACLDHIFKQKQVTCLVNPRACYETHFSYARVKYSKKIGIVGAGSSGLSLAITAAQKGHDVHLFESTTCIGGQLNLAKQIPGKEEFYEMIRYFNVMIQEKKIKLSLNVHVTAQMLNDFHFDHLVIATGVTPYIPNIEGIEHSKVISYQKLIENKIAIGKNVAIIGAGGIGFDIAEYLVDEAPITAQAKNWNEQWGIDRGYENRGALMKAHNEPAYRNIYLLQRQLGKMGKSLGKTSGWVHRLTLKQKKVTMLSGIEYVKINNEGLHIKVCEVARCLAVDHIILCAGQKSNHTLYDELQLTHHYIESRYLKRKEVFTDELKYLHLIGGAHSTQSLDAQKAIREGMELALRF
jgi:2,4-dienoyl-CoA reductase (NADPH2)